MLQSSQTNEKLFKIQCSMESKINNTPRIDKYRYIGGADLTDRDGIIVGCFVVVDCQDNLKVINQKCIEMITDTISGWPFVLS